jgi:hypothetical protein
LEKRTGFKGNQDTASGQNARKQTSEQLAKEYNVDEKTIRRDGEFTKAVDSLRQDIKQSALKEEINKQEAIELSKLPQEKQKAWWQSSEKDDWWTPQKAKEAL